MAFKVGILQLQMSFPWIIAVSYYCDVNQSAASVVHDCLICLLNARSFPKYYALSRYFKTYQRDTLLDSLHRWLATSLPFDSRPADTLLYRMYSTIKLSNSIPIKAKTVLSRSSN